MTMSSPQKLYRFLSALDLAILVVNEECPTSPEANVEELKALRDLRGEIHEAILALGKSHPVVETAAMKGDARNGALKGGFYNPKF